MSQARVYVETGAGLPYIAEMNKLDRSEAALEVLRMASAEEQQRPEPRLLSRMLALSDMYTAGDYNAMIHAFVEAGGRPSGDQLAFAGLGMLGVSLELEEDGVRIISVHNTTTMRAAWYELRELWELVNRPDVRAHMWPQLGDPRTNAKEILEPLQDIVLLGLFTQISFAAVGQSSERAWDAGDLKAEARRVLDMMSLPPKRVEALLEGAIEDISFRVSVHMTTASIMWLLEGGWDAGRRMFAPFLTRTVSKPIDTFAAGSRVDELGRWVWDGTIAPRLERGLGPAPAAEDEKWALRVITEALKQGPDRLEVKPGHLLWRTFESLESGEALVVDATDAQAAKTASELFGLDLIAFESWSEEQKVDLRSGLLFLKRLCSINASMEQVRRTPLGQRKPSTPRSAKSQGFGGGKRSDGPARKGKRKNKR